MVFLRFAFGATYFLRAQKVGKDAPKGGTPIVSLPLDSHPAAPKGCCDTPLESPGSMSHRYSGTFLICAKRRGYLAGVGEVLRMMAMLCAVSSPGRV